MKVKVRRAYFGAEGQTREGMILDISESRYRQLTEGIHLNHPLVDAMEIGFKMEAAPKNKMEAAPANKKVDLASTFQTADRIKRSMQEAAKSGAADPTPSPLDGGQTGAVSVASLSEPVPPRVKRKYTRRAVKPEASPSIAHGN